MVKLSIIIPSKNEIFLNQTIQSVLDNATGDIEVLPVLNGYEPDTRIIDERVTYLRLPTCNFSTKRHSINIAVEQSEGDIIMALDAHCMVAPGFDEVLTRDIKDNMIMIPRRHRLDAENWSLQPQADQRPPIDYEYFMWSGFHNDKGLHGFKWDARTLERADKMIDDNLTFQGSCWVMTKDHFNRHKFMDYENYMGWGQEAEELGLTTWLSGGRVVTNKNTWYAHLHKGQKYGRMYFMDKAENRKSYAYSYAHWTSQPGFFDLLERFMPLPGWPERKQWIP